MTFLEKKKRRSNRNRLQLNAVNTTPAIFRKKKKFHTDYN